MWVDITQPKRDLQRTTIQKIKFLSFLLGRGHMSLSAPSKVSGSWTQSMTYIIATSILGFHNSGQITWLDFLFFYLEDGRLWDFLASMIMWVNSCTCACVGHSVFVSLFLSPSIPPSFSSFTWPSHMYTIYNVYHTYALLILICWTHYIQYITHLWVYSISLENIANHSIWRIETKWFSLRDSTGSLSLVGTGPG